VPAYLCVSHYAEYGQLLVGPKTAENAWVREMVNWEKQRRKRRGRYFEHQQAQYLVIGAA